MFLNTYLTEEGNTPIHAAVVNNDVYVVRILLAYNETDINKANKFGWTPIYTAAVNGYNEILTMLLNKNAKVNEKIKTKSHPVILKKNNSSETILTSKVAVG